MTSEELLKQHYNQANALYQAGNLRQAHQELQTALTYASTDQQRDAIQDNVKRIEAQLEQEQTEATQPTAVDSPPRSAFPFLQNKMFVITLLVGLVFLTPVLIKCIESFTPRKPVAEASPSPESSASPAASETDPETTATTETATTPVANEALISANSVNLREQPSRQAARVASLSLNQKVQILEDKTQAADGLTWSKIQTAEGQTGWISAAYLNQTTTTDTQAATPPAADSQQTTNTSPAAPAATEMASAAPDNAAASAAPTGPVARVSASGVSLRSGPSVSQALLRTLPAGTELELLPTAGVNADNLDWVQVKTQTGEVGWMAKKFLTP